MNLIDDRSNLLFEFYTDDEDDYQETANGSIHDTDRSREEKRRISHTAAEQKRRNAIKVSVRFFSILCLLELLPLKLDFKNGN